MSQERFQSETGQTIDDNGCSLFFGNTSPLFYTVNPRSGISLRQQEQLGAPSILKSFRDLPGCTRLSTSLTNLDSSSNTKRAQFPLLPDISQKGNMGKSLQGHHSSSKRFVRERYNPPFKVNAKIRHVYTQEVTTIEPTVDHPRSGEQNHHSLRHSSQNQHHRHSSNLRNSQSYHDVVTCHRQTQTEPPVQLSPESKQIPEAGEDEHAKVQENNADNGNGVNTEKTEALIEGSIIREQKQKMPSRANSNTVQETSGQVLTDETENRAISNKVDASTSPIPSPFFTYPDYGESSANPFSGCSQMTVYPPLNYVRKLEDLEKITGHIVIQRFFTKTDDAFGTWLERQLGMTTKSVSVDTSEFENAKTAELQDVDEKVEDDIGGMQADSGIDTASGETTDATVATDIADGKRTPGDEISSKNENETMIMLNDTNASDINIPVEENADVEKLEAKVEFITGAILSPGDGGLQETENLRPAEDNPLAADCDIADPVKCECYLDEIKQAEEKNDVVKEVEQQIIPENISLSDAATEVKLSAEEVETLISTVVPVLPTATEEDNNKVAPETAIKSNKSEEEIDEMVRCTLEAYLMAPLAFEDISENDEVETEIQKNELESLSSPTSATTVKSQVDSGRADSIQSQENNKSFEGMVDTEGNTTSHDSVETVYEIPIDPPKGVDLENGPTRVLQRCLSADSCIGTESSGDAKNPTTNASQSSNDTIEVIDPIHVSKELVDLNTGSPASAPPTSARSQTTKLPTIPSAKSIKLNKNYRSLSSARSQRSLSPGNAGPVEAAPGSGRVRGSRTNAKKTDVEAEDADGESETESEITDNQYLLSGRPSKLHHPDGTDLELEEVEEDDGDDDDRDAFDKMVANHLKYSRGLPTATNSRRSRLNRGTQTTKSIEPSTTSGSISSCSSSNSSFDVEIISKSKRITTASSSAGGMENDQHQDLITPSNMTLAWHEGGRRRSYLPSSSSSLNLLNMKFSLGKDFESEVSIRMPNTNKSSMLSGNSANFGSASMLLPGSGGTTGKTPLMSSSGRTHHHHHYQSYPQNRGLSSSSQHSAHQHHNNQTLQSPLTSATTTTMQMMSESKSVPSTELQSLWKDVRTKLDCTVDEIAATIIPEEEDNEELQVRGSGILPADPHPSSGSSMVKIRRNEEKIKRSLQRLKKILDD